MKKRLSVTLLAACVALPAQAAILGPSPYLSQADSPFHPGDFDYFYLEDVEDNLINTAGLRIGPGCITGFDCFAGSGATDSVGNGGNGYLGRTIFSEGSTWIEFDPLVLGSLPTAAGLVWTDGINPVRFEAFDQNGLSLGVTTSDHATLLWAGQTDEDRFYGATNPGGISRLLISNPPGLEIDHIQYGGFNSDLITLRESVVPEPATWALMIAGFGLAGVGLRLNRTRRPAH